MARPKRNRKMATGIQRKKGYLYIVLSQPVIKDGIKRTEKKWVSTGLTDTPDNVKKASEIRRKLLGSMKASAIDRNITVSDYIDHFLEQKKREISETTYSSYETRGKRIKKALGRLRIRDIDTGTVESFLDGLFENSNARPRTVKDTKVFFGSVIEQAVKEGITTHNPVKEAVINKSLASKHAKEKNADEEFFSYEEAKLFLSRTKEHELYELYYLTLFFGLRREEVLGLRWSAVDFKDKNMSISHTVTKASKVIRSNTTKTASSAREYPLTDEQVDMFRKLKERETANRKLFGDGYYNSEYIFKHADGTLYHPDHLSKTFKKIIKKIPELPQEITFHGLRSSCVSILVHQGMDPKSIQKWVGHADINTTLRIYAKVKDKEAKKEVSDKMNDLLQLKKYKEQ